MTATPRPWGIRWNEDGSVGCLTFGGGQVVPSANPEDTRLIMRAVNEYEALLGVADAAAAVDDEHAYGVAAAMGTAEKLRQALAVLDSVRRGAS